jgi:hypothetical protein
VGSYVYLVGSEGVVEEGGGLPGEGPAEESEVAGVVEALVEGVEERAVEDLVEVLEVVEVLAEEDDVGLVESSGDLHDDRPLLHLPEELEDAIGDDHEIGLVVLVAGGDLHRLLLR